MKVTESSVPKKGVLQPPSETLRAPPAACRAAAHNVPRSQAHLRSLLFKNNVHLKFGQELLGHASVTITLETSSHPAARHGRRSRRHIGRSDRIALG